VWHEEYGHFGVNIEDGKYRSMTFFDDDARQLAEKFFSAI